MASTVQINIQIERIREQKEKNREKAAREASKRGESGSLTEDGKLHRCHSFNSIFLPPKITLKTFFMKKYIFFVNSVKQVSANFLEMAM